MKRKEIRRRLRVEVTRVTMIQISRSRLLNKMLCQLFRDQEKQVYFHETSILLNISLESRKWKRRRKYLNKNKVLLSIWSKINGLIHLLRIKDLFWLVRKVRLSRLKSLKSQNDSRAFHLC